MSSGAMSRKGSTEVYIPSVDRKKKPKNSRLGGTPADHKRSRTKGADGEREARDLWRRWFPDCKRIIGQARRGSESPDIGCADMNKLYYVEVKRYKKITDGLIRRLFFKMECDHAAWCDANEWEDEPTPVLLFRQDNEPWYVAVDWEYYPELQTEYTIMRDGGEIAIVPWSSFAITLDKLHGGKDE